MVFSAKSRRQVFTTEVKETLKEVYIEILKKIYHYILNGIAFRIEILSFYTAVLSNSYIQQF